MCSHRSPFRLKRVDYTGYSAVGQEIPGCRICGKMMQTYAAQVTISNGFFGKNRVSIRAVVGGTPSRIHQDEDVKAQACSAQNNSQGDKLRARSSFGSCERVLGGFS